MAQMVIDRTLALSEIHLTEPLGHSLSETSAKVWHKHKALILKNTNIFEKYIT